MNLSELTRQMMDLSRRIDEGVQELARQVDVRTGDDAMNQEGN